MRFYDIALFVIVLNLLFTVFNAIPFYYDETGTSHTLGPIFNGSSTLTPDRLLANVSCTLSANGSTTCLQPSALGSPAVANTVFSFGFFTAGLDFIFGLAGVGGFVYTIMKDVGVPAVFAAVVSGGINVIFVMSIIYVITGRQVES